MLNQNKLDKILDEILRNQHAYGGGISTSPSDQFRLCSCNFKVKFGNLSQTSCISTENLFNPSQRKDSKGHVLAQICQKVGLEVVKVRNIHVEFVILALARFEILDHSIHSSRNRQKVKLLSHLQQIISVC